MFAFIQVVCEEVFQDNMCAEEDPCLFYIICGFAIAFSAMAYMMTEVIVVMIAYWDMPDDMNVGHWFGVVFLYAIFGLICYVCYIAGSYLVLYTWIVCFAVRLFTLIPSRDP